MTLVRSLENRKRLEERERKRLEARAEKLANREKKLEQRRIDVELLTEIRKPVEDMELGDEKGLPALDRMSGLQLSGQAFLDTLMVFEFLHTFGETLGFGEWYFSFFTSEDFILLWIVFWSSASSNFGFL